MTLPMTLIIVTGEIDLSVASILGMSSALLGDLVQPWLADVARDRHGSRCRRRGGLVQRLPGDARRAARRSR